MSTPIRDRRRPGRGCACTPEPGGVFCPVHDAGGPADQRRSIPVERRLGERRGTKTYSHSGSIGYDRDGGRVLYGTRFADRRGAKP